MRMIIAGLVALLWTAPLAAADLTGSWKISAEGQAVAILTLDAAANGQWAGSILRPSGMQIDDGVTVSNLSGAPSERRLRGTRRSADHAELQLDPARPGEDQLRFLVNALDDSHAELIISFAGQAARAIPLARTVAGSALGTGWSDRTYAIDASWPDNAEMTTMFEADQAARRAPNIDWAKLAPEDARRRDRARQLLNEGKLRSAGDYYAAAFIFQHGEEAKDYLFAHTLALIAASRGRRNATWIAAATLDRYLQKIGQPQVYGTQYFTRPGEAVTQEPYDRSLVSDTLRTELGVPPISAQEERRQAMQASRSAKP